jgi:hypothetical protein
VVAAPHAAVFATLIIAAPALANSFGPPAAYDLAVSPATMFPIGGPAMNSARAIADQYWGYDPCGGTVAMSWQSEAPTVNATSTWSNPGDPYANPQQNVDCSVVFNSMQGFDWPMLCTVFVHEFGHLTGHMHVQDDPTNVMYPFYNQPIAQCKTAVAAAPPPAKRPVATATTRSHKGAHHKHKRKHKRKHKHKRNHKQQGHSSRGAWHSSRGTWKRGQ